MNTLAESYPTNKSTSRTAKKSTKPTQEKIDLENKLAGQQQYNQLQHAHKTVELSLTKESIDIDRMKLIADI